MKIRILSDLHLEYAPWTAPRIADVDVVVLAGDIYAGLEGISWARSQFGTTPIIYVPGNHEFFGEELDSHLAALREKGKKCGVFVLDEEEVSIKGVRFLGATCWTDYRLDGVSPAVEEALVAAELGMDDFKAISKGAEIFSPSIALELHRSAVEFIENSLQRRRAGSTVIVTHHAPSKRSVAAKYEKSSLNPSFASNLTRFMGPAVPLWVHGHTHDSFDYLENGTRVICNPRGCAPMSLNPGFKPSLIVEV